MSPCYDVYHAEQEDGQFDDWKTAVIKEKVVS